MKKKDVFRYLSGGVGMDSWIKPVCWCGWTGNKHYAHNDYQFSNARDELIRHIKRDHEH